MIFSKNKSKLKKKLKDEISMMELQLEHQSYKNALKSGDFSKKTITFCILFISIFALICAFITYRTGYQTYELLKMICAVFGGELLLLLIKRRWDTEDSDKNTFIKKFKKIRQNDVNEIDLNKTRQNDVNEIDLNKTNQIDINVPSVNNILPTTINHLREEISDIDIKLGGGVG